MPTFGRTCTKFRLLTGIGSWPAKAAGQPVAASLTSSKARCMSVTVSLTTLLRAGSAASHHEIWTALMLKRKLAAQTSAAAAGARVAYTTCQDQATFSPVSAVYTWQVVQSLGCAASRSARSSNSRSPTTCAVRTGTTKSKRERDFGAGTHVDQCSFVLASSTYTFSLSGNMQK